MVAGATWFWMVRAVARGRSNFEWLAARVFALRWICQWSAFHHSITDMSTTKSDPRHFRLFDWPERIVHCFWAYPFIYLSIYLFTSVGKETFFNDFLEELHPCFAYCGFIFAAGEKHVLFYRFVGLILSWFCKETNMISVANCVTHDVVCAVRSGTRSWMIARDMTNMKVKATMFVYVVWNHAGSKTWPCIDHVFETTDGCAGLISWPGKKSRKNKYKIEKYIHIYLYKYVCCVLSNFNEKCCDSNSINMVFDRSWCGSSW